MKRTITTLLAAATLTAAFPVVASAQTFVDARQSGIIQQIDQGQRNGELSRNEAERFRAEFNALLRLEADYRRGGLTRWEAQDLQQRLQILSQRVRAERNDRDRDRREDGRATAIERQIEAGLRSGGLNRREASRLTAELEALVRLERTYRRDGLSQWERRELDQRYDALAHRVRTERRDGPNGRGPGGWDRR